jgi:hypothetical protein
MIANPADGLDYKMINKGDLCMKKNNESEIVR